METGFIVLLIVAPIILVLGIVLGITLGKTKKPTVDSYGVVYVDYSDPTRDPILYLGVGVTIDEIASQKRVAFDVDIIK